MTDKLPNFIRADEAMKAAEEFFRQAGDICLRNADAAQDVIDRLFLTHAAQASQRLASALYEQRKKPDSAAQQTYVQYAPSEPVPGSETLSDLENEGRNAATALEHLDRWSRNWMNIFKHFERQADTEREQELHAACAQLIDTWRRGLAETYQQRDQM